MMRRLRCLFRHHLWQPESNGGNRYVCSRCGAHVSAITDAQRRFEEPGGGGGGHLGGAPTGGIDFGGDGRGGGS
jgi:hypothetical protein